MTPLTQQLEDKKKGCGCEFIDGKNVYNCGERWYTHHIKGDVYDYLPNYCSKCEYEIAILEQAIAEIKNIQSQQNKNGHPVYLGDKGTDLTGSADISNLLQKQRQEILERIYFILKDIKCNSHQFISETEECFDREWEEMLEKLNQPKTEKENSK